MSTRGIDSTHAPHDLLGGEDAAWLHMESDTSPMVVSGVLDLAARLPVARIREIVERMAAMPRFRAVIQEAAGAVGRPHWQPCPDPDLDYHLRHVELEDSDEPAIQAFIGVTISEALDPGRPLWRVYLVDRPYHGSTLLFRVHHAIADGFALLGLMLSVCDADPAGEEQLGAVRPAVAKPTIRSATTAFRRLVSMPPDTATYLKAPLSGKKVVAWTAPVPLERLRDVAHATKASVNDVVISVVSGALRRQLRRCHQDEPGIRLHAMVPVNLRSDTRTISPDNHIGLVVVDLPVSIDDPIARVAAAEQRMRGLKSTPEAIVAHELLRALGGAPKRLEDVVVSFFAKKTSLVLTNVPGPRIRLAIAGVPISRVVFWVPQAGRLGLGISVLSYAGDVTFGVIADAAVVPRPDVLASDLEHEVAELTEAVRSEQTAGGHVSPPCAWRAWKTSLEPI